MAPSVTEKLREGSFYIKQMLQPIVLRFFPSQQRKNTQLSQAATPNRAIQHLTVISNLSGAQRFPKTEINESYKIYNWTNSIKTSRYTWWNFLVLNLLHQLKSLLVLFYLTMAILQTFPAISETGGKPTFLLPLSIVMLITALHDAYEDIQRHHQDECENTKVCSVFNDGSIEKTAWQNIKVGDVVKVSIDEPIPADLILLNCSDAYGLAYIDTIDLDGESNLKSKVCIPELINQISNDVEAANIHIMAEYEVPSNELYRFQGTLNVQSPSTALSHADEKQTILVTTNQFICRGATLRNTTWIYGIVVYTGLHTRILKNTASRTIRQSKFFHDYIEFSKILVGLQLALCLFAAIYFTAFKQPIFTIWDFAIPNDSNIIGLLSFTLTFFRFVLLLSYFLPISILIEVELCRWIQAFFISRDKAMQSSINQSMASTRSISLCDDLGNVSHIFSDKTGTLTQNLLTFRALGFKTKIYGFSKKSPIPEFNSSDCLTHVTFDQIEPKFDVQDFHMHFSNSDTKTKQALVDLLLTMAICHSALTKATRYEKQNSDCDYETKALKNKISPSEYPIQFNLDPIPLSIYEASSPDEVSLCTAAQEIGIEFFSRQNIDSIELLLRNEAFNSYILSDKDLNLLQKKKEKAIVQNSKEPLNSGTVSVRIEIVEILEFDNYRKRMSVIIKDRKGQLRLLTKGADNSILSIAANGQDKEIEETKEQLRLVSSFGFRTLLFGHRFVTESEAKDLRASMTESASTAALDQDEVTRRAYSNIEVNLEILGFTCIEDKLQDMVSETIVHFRTCGIKIWMLTGDKVETAVSIAHSCGLMSENTYNTVIDGSTSADVQQQLERLASYLIAGEISCKAFDLRAARNLHRSIEKSGVQSKNKPQRNNLKWSCIPLCTKQSIRLCSNFDNVQDPSHFTASDNLIQAQRPTLQLDEFVNVLKNSVFWYRKKGSKDIKGAAYGKKIEKIIGAYIQHFAFSQQIEKVKTIPSYSNYRTKIVLTSETSTANIPTTCNVTSSAIEATSQNIVNDKDNQYFKKKSTKLKVYPTSRYVNPHYTNEASPLQYVHRTSSAASPSAKMIEEPAYVQQYDMVSITVTGEALIQIFSKDYLKEYFFKLAEVASTIIACRVSPIQKAQLVKEWRRCNADAISLAVGDGSNDIPMLHTSSVGVGMIGREGLQAAREADFVIGEFKFLRNLLFVHGKESLRRRSMQVFVSIWKNISIGACNFFFGFYSVFSAVEMHNPWLKQFFNALYTCLPLYFISNFDQELPYKILLDSPFLYTTSSKLGRKHFLSRKLLLGWISYGLFVSCTSVVVPITSFTTDTIRFSTSITFDLSKVGLASLNILILVANLSCILVSSTWSWLYLYLILIFELIFWYSTWVLCPRIGHTCSDLRGSFVTLQESLSFHLNVIVGTAIAIFPLLIFKFLKVIFKPSLENVIQERISVGVFDVVVAPSTGQRIAVVVPKVESEEWRGYAFSENEQVPWYKRFQRKNNVINTSSVANETEEIRFHEA